MTAQGAGAAPGRVGKASVFIRGFISAAALGYVVNLFMSSLDAAGVKGLSLAYAYLVGMWFVALVGVAVAESFLTLSFRKRLELFGLMAAAMTLLCVGTGLYERKRYTEELMLLPGAYNVPTDGCGKLPIPTGVSLGSNWDGISSYPFALMTLEGRPIFTLDKGDNGLLVKNVVLFDDRHDAILTIDDNTIWKGSGTRVEHPDKSTLLVYDHNAEIILKLRYLNQNALWVGGAFRNNRYPVYILDKMMVFTQPSGLKSATLTNNCFQNSALVQTDHSTEMQPLTRWDGVALKVWEK